MDSSYDIAIIGAGLAGSFSAFNLSGRMRMLVLEKDRVASGATGAGAGLVNPFMARKANPMWRWEEALDAFEETLGAAGYSELFRRTGILRPASDERAAGWFKETVADHPEAATWMDAASIRGSWPAISADHGALFIERGGCIDPVALTEALLSAAENRGCELHDGTTALEFREEGESILLETDRGEIRARRLLLCVGADYSDWPLLGGMGLHGLKGQTIAVERPTGLRGNLPCLAGAGYVVPYPDYFIMGSTYHHDFADRDPTDDDTREILAKISGMLPGLEHPEVLFAAAGVRVTVPGTRLPLVGPITESGRIWTFTGLGSKGLLLGALIGRSLPAYLEAPAKVPADLRPA